MVKSRRLEAMALFGVGFCILYVMLPFTPLGFLCGPFDVQAGKYNDAARGWLHSWHGQYDGWTDVSNSRGVQESKMPNAELLLQSAAVVPLTDAQVLELTGRQAPTVKQGRPYLLRAVGAFQDRLPLEVFKSAKGDIWVAGGALGRCPVPMRRLAVVAWLDQQPKDIYVTFTVE